MLLLFLFPQAVREMHHWAAHMDPRLECHPGEGETHFHDAHYAFHHCDYCAISIGFYIAPSALWQVKRTVPAHVPSNYLYPSAASNTVHLNPPLRGPPFCV